MIKHIISLLRQLMRRSPGKLAAYAGILVLVCGLVFLFWPHAYIDGLIKDRVTRVLAEAYPAYSIQMAGIHYGILWNRLECDSVRIMKADSTLVCSVTKLSVAGMDRMQLLWGGTIAPENFAASHADVEGIRLTLPRSRYELRCARLRASLPDSVLELEVVRYAPPVDDEQFFAQSTFRSTRFRLDIPRCRVTGLGYLGLVRGNYRARAARVFDASLAVLVNKDKPVDKTSPDPRMPNAILSSVKGPLRIDSISVMNGQLTYDERFGVAMPPAAITWDSVQILAEAVGNAGDTAVIRARGNLMNTGAMSMHMSLPVGSPGLTFRYSGVLGGMALTAFNPFIEISDHKRLKTGVLHSAAFDINVTNGKATGVTRATYKDLKIVAIDGRTGSEAGVVNTFLSLFANNVKLRTTNMPDDSGATKFGKVEYTKKPDETFFEFAWFALRSGVGDLVGF